MKINLFGLLLYLREDHRLPSTEPVVLDHPTVASSPPTNNGIVGGEKETEMSGQDGRMDGNVCNNDEDSVHCIDDAGKCAS